MADNELHDYEKINAEELEELCRFVEENTYSDFDEKELEIKEREWNEHLGDIETFQQLSLLRKKKARKQEDEEAYRAFELKKKRWEEWKANEEANDFGWGSMGKMSYAMRTEVDAGEPRPQFNDVFEKYRNEHNAGSYADICRNSNMKQETLSKIRKGNLNDIQREYLFALAFGLKLSWDETGELFESCGKCHRNGYRLSKDEERRERIIGWCIDHKKTIKTLNDYLRDEKYRVLGNFIIA